MDAKRIDTVGNVALVDKANVPRVPMLFKGPRSARSSGRQRDWCALVWCGRSLRPRGRGGLPRPPAVAASLLTRMTNAFFANDWELNHGDPKEKAEPTLVHVSHRDFLALVAPCSPACAWVRRRGG